MNNGTDMRKINAHDAQIVHEDFLVHFYRKFTQDGQFVPIHGTNGTSSDQITLWLQLHGVDVVITSPKTKKVMYVEEKADWHMPVNLFLEEVSNTVTETPVPGWIETSISDILLYTFMWIPDIADVYALDFHRLRTSHRADRERYTGYTMPDTVNKSFGRIVPLEDIIRHVRVRRYLISRDGTIINIPPRASVTQYIKNLYTFADIHAEQERKDTCALFDDESEEEGDEDGTDYGELFACEQGMKAADELFADQAWDDIVEQADSSPSTERHTRGVGEITEPELPSWFLPNSPIFGRDGQ